MITPVEAAVVGRTTVLKGRGNSNKCTKSNMSDKDRPKLIKLSSKELKKIETPSFSYAGNGRRRNVADTTWSASSDDDAVCACCSSDCCTTELGPSLTMRRYLCSRPGRVAAVSVISLIITYWLYYRSGNLDGTVNANGENARVYNFNHSHSIQVLNELCDKYQAGYLSGDLCNRLCYDRQWEIQEYYDRNKIVYVLLLGGQKTLLKSQFGSIDQFDLIDGANVTNDAFSDMILELTNYHLQLGWPSDYKHHLMNTLWPMLKRTHTLSAADRRSLWSLVTQDEYLTFKVMPLTRMFPKVIGSCGNFYSVEYIVPFRMKTYYTNLKAKILVHLMGTLKLLYEFLNEPLHWCDVKFENFGLSADYPKRFLIMDADMLFTDSRLRYFMKSKHCNTHAECEFFDCQAECDMATNRCTERINDNVDVFCKKLVSALFGNFWTKTNRYLAACHDTSMNATDRLNDLRLVWSWSLSDV